MKPPYTLGDMFLLREAVASVSLSHPERCDCVTCRAALGDEDAMASVFLTLRGDDQPDG